MTSLQQNDTIPSAQSSETEQSARFVHDIMSEDYVKKKFDSIKKSPNDTRNYRGLLLNNDMKVLLISDPTTEKGAAALNVQIGYFNDPDELPGLAHFCEHMLFLGTEKYPDKNAYNSYLSQHGGCSNANTQMDCTNYYFDVNSDHLDGALDRFVQFFIHPLFTETATDLEVNAVNSEHEKNICDDNWRFDHLDKSSANPNHAYSKFGTGNIETLDQIPKSKGINVREELLKFHKTWYSSNIMAVSVLGKENLDDLEQMVVKKFVQVKNSQVTAPTWPEHPFTSDHFGHKWFITPIKDIRTLKIIFPLPDLHEYYKSAPSHYIAHLLGHEGEGSLLSALKQAGWSNSLVAGNRKVARGACNFFNVVVDLTEEGVEHVDDIITLTFQYINLLKESGPQEWIFEECQQIAQMNFNFTEKSTPQTYVYSTVHSVQKYPIDEVLIAPCVPSSWQPELINMVLEYLVPEKIRVHIVGKVFSDMTDDTLMWYGTKYKKIKIPEGVLNTWKHSGVNCDHTLPLKNEFIPESFDIKSLEGGKTNKFPVVIEDSPLMRVWFKQDDEFFIPKVNITLDISSPLIYLDPLSCNLTQMFIALFKDALNKYIYNAELAGLSWSFNSSKYGVTMIISGYHDKHRTFLKKILNEMVTFRIDRQRFEILKELYVRSLKNFEIEQPYQHVVYYLAVLLTEQAWTKNELIDCCDHVTVERLEEFIPQLLTKIYIECLIHGNLTEAEAMETVRLIEDEVTQDPKSQEKRVIVPLLPKQLTLHREISLEDGCYFLYEVENKFHKSSCTQVYYQSGFQSTETNMMLELFAQIIGEPVFDVLRTKEQLGYIVFSGIRRSNGAQGLRVIVQSDKHPRFVEERIDSFMESVEGMIEEMNAEEFDRHKASLATKRLEKPKMMAVLSGKFWGEISSQQYNFDRTNIEVAYLRTITKDQIRQFFKEKIHQKSADRRKLSVHVISTAEGGAGLAETDIETNATLITDVIGFKGSQSLYPLIKPFDGVPRKGHRSKL